MCNTTTPTVLANHLVYKLGENISSLKKNTSPQFQNALYLKEA